MTTIWYLNNETMQKSFVGGLGLVCDLNDGAADYHTIAVCTLKVTDFRRGKAAEFYFAKPSEHHFSLASYVPGTVDVNYLLKVLGATSVKIRK